MSKAPPKAGASTPRPRLVGGKVPQTWATMAATAVNNVTETPTTATVTSSEGDVNQFSPPNIQSSSTATSQVVTYGIIAEMLADIIQGGKLDTSTKQNLAKVIKLAKEAETKEKEKDKGAKTQEEVSVNREAMRQDLVRIHDLLAEQIHKVKEDCSVILDSTNKVLKGVEEAKNDTRDLTCKVNKVTDAADKIASDMNLYWDVLLSKPTPTNRSAADPRVLSDMD